MGRTINAIGAFLAALVGTAVAQECPADSSTPLWNQAGCDLALSPGEFVGGLERARSIFPAGQLSEDDLKAAVVFFAGGGEPIELGAPATDWMVAPVGVMSRGELNGILSSRELSKAEMEMDQQLLGAALQGRQVGLADVMTYAQTLVENRGGRLLVGLGLHGVVFPMAVSVRNYCRWADVKLPEFAMLASIEHLGNDGTVQDVTWSNAPNSCDGFGS